jgi:type IV pilus assembly protein PilY1
MKRFSAIALAIVLALSWFLTEEAAFAGSPGQLTGGEKQISMSELPMFTRINPPPAAIMFLIDDSSSMDHEILMVADNDDFTYPHWKWNTETAKWDWTLFTAGAYLFDMIVGDYSEDQPLDALNYLGPLNRKFWKTQWSKGNLLYYDPKRDYAPWLSSSGTAMLNADPMNPRSNPMIEDYKLSLSETSFTVGTGASSINVAHAHYFMYSASENSPYLVVVDGGIRYYKVSVTIHERALNDTQKYWWEVVSGLTEKSEGSTPGDVKTSRSYIEERQNFANWYTYHRRREFAAKGPLGELILGLKNVRVGLYGINSHSSLPNTGSGGHPILSGLKSVKVIKNGNMEDKTAELMDATYRYRSRGMTPLRKGLGNVGAFFKNNDGKLLGTNITGEKPFEADCQQAVTVIITDGYNNYYGTVLPSGERNADENNGQPYADSYSDTLADIAMYYYERDLLASLNNKVPAVNPLDDNPGQHMVTYAVAFGVRGTLDPNDYVNFKKKTDQTWIVWPEPKSGENSRLDDLWHATVNGRGQFFSAYSPEELNKAMKELSEAFSNMAKGSASSVAVNGDKISPNSFAYQASFSSKDGEWLGDLDAYKINSTDGKIDDHEWSAAQELQSKDWDTGRVIASYDSVGKKGIKFRAEDLSNDQKTQLGVNEDGAAVKLVNYLRGKETPGYRDRSQKLGDIVNSSPVYQDEVLFVGANDGMLHAFDAATGKEIFAYVPNLVFPKLKELSSPTYSHKFYVDLTPVVKKGVLMPNNTEVNMLVGGLRQGGKGYFALNILNPKSITTEEMLKSRVMWEAPEASDPDMGLSYCKPIIVRSNSTAYPWVVIFGNGYNSVSEKAVLYVLNPQSGATICKIEAHSGTSNGLSNALIIDANYDEKVDFAYAGDLQGNMWKFDLRDSDYTKWGVAFKNGTDPAPLFQAKDAVGKVQPITSKPDIMYHPEKNGFLVCFGTGRFLNDDDFQDTGVQSIYGVWDYGDTVFDLRQKTWSSDDDSEFLGSFDRSAGKHLSNQPGKVEVLAQTPSDITLTINSKSYKLRWLTEHKPIWKTTDDTTATQEPNPSSTETNHVGYHIDLPAGERVISDVIIRGGVLLALSFKPTSDPCGSGGDSMFMEINAFTGGSPVQAMFDINGDGKVDAGDLIEITVNGTIKKVPPTGVQFGGFLQTPAIMRLGPLNTAGTEIKYFSSSDGEIKTLAERAPKLGLTHWMEVRH